MGCRPDTCAPCSNGCGAENPQNPPYCQGDDCVCEPGLVLEDGARVQPCTDQYCARYLVGSRGKAEVSSGTSNLGFRLVRTKN